MPICEADPWRLQYFEHAVCPPDINIPTEDCDAWLWYPEHRWVYDKIAIAQAVNAIPEERRTRIDLDSIRATSVALRVEGSDDGFVLEGVSHWIPEEAADELNRLLLDHLSSA